MLRNVVLGLGVLMLAGGVIALAAGGTPAGIPAIVLGALFVLGILCERIVYKKVADQAPLGPGWKRTAERFVEEETGRTVTVYVKPATGERAYVAETAGKAPSPTSVLGG
jgi:hypothetical protein